MVISGYLIRDVENPYGINVSYIEHILQLDDKQYIADLLQNYRFFVFGHEKLHLVSWPIGTSLYGIHAEYKLDFIHESCTTTLIDHETKHFRKDSYVSWPLIICKSKPLMCHILKLMIVLFCTISIHAGTAEAKKEESSPNEEPLPEESSPKEESSPEETSPKTDNENKDETYQAKIEDVTDASITVSWTKPQQDYDKITQYHVTCTLKGGEQTGSEVAEVTLDDLDVRTATMSDLKPATEYVLEVFAMKGEWDADCCRVDTRTSKKEIPGYVDNVYFHALRCNKLKLRPKKQNCLITRLKKMQNFPGIWSKIPKFRIFFMRV